MSKISYTYTLDYKYITNYNNNNDKLPDPLDHELLRRSADEPNANEKLTATSAVATEYAETTPAAARAAAVAFFKCQ